MQERIFEIPADVAAKLAANRSAYDVATAQLAIKPVWTMNEIWNEPVFEAFAKSCLDAVGVTGGEAMLYPGGVRVTWRES